MSEAERIAREALEEIVDGWLSPRELVPAMHVIDEMRQCARDALANMDVQDKADGNG